MILGLNAVANPIEYGVFSPTDACYERWDGLGQIEQLPKKLADVMANRAPIRGIVTILGPGNYTGIRLALTAAKMMAKVHQVPCKGLTLFEAFMHIQPVKQLTVLSSPSRKGWLNVQLFQSNQDGHNAISNIQQVAVDAYDAWLNKFESPLFCAHFGPELPKSKHVVMPVALNLMDVALAMNFNDDGRHKAIAPVYSFPAV